MSPPNDGGRIALLLSAAHVTAIVGVTYADDPGCIALLFGSRDGRERIPIFPAGHE